VHFLHNNKGCGQKSFAPHGVQSSMFLAYSSWSCACCRSRLYPLIFYGSLSISLVLITVLETRELLLVQHHGHFHKAPAKNGHRSVERRHGPILEETQGASDGKTSDENSIKGQQNREIPEWVLQPAMTRESSVDPMEGLKQCLLEGQTLPECTEVYRAKEPTSGVQGLKMLLLEACVAHPVELVCVCVCVYIYIYIYIYIYTHLTAACIYVGTCRA
jgi:hypothetical protein